MRRLLNALIVSIGLAAQAFAGPYQGITLSTPTGTATENLSGYLFIAGSSQTPTVYRVTFDGVTGAAMVRSLGATGPQGLTISSATTVVSSFTITGAGGLLVTNAVTASTFYGSGANLTGITSGSDRVLRTGDTMTGQLTLAGSTLTVGGNAFSVGVSTLVVASGSLGIGTTSPLAQIHVRGPTTSKGLLHLSDNVDNSPNASNYLSFGDAAGNRLGYMGNTGDNDIYVASEFADIILTALGNVGIKNFNPTVALDVTGSAKVSGSLAVAGAISGAGITGSSVTATATGAAQYSVGTSSGISMGTGQFLIGAGGYVQWPDGTRSTTAASGSGGGSSAPSDFGWITDNFLGQVNGTQTVFTLSQRPTNQSAIFVVLDGLLQSGASDYTYAAPFTITMATAPAADSSSFFVRYSTGAISGGSAVPVTVNASLTGDGSSGSPLGVNPASGTLQGNTFNGANQLTKLGADGGQTISSQTLTGGGANVYSQTLSSGIHVLNGEVKLEPGSYIRWPDQSTSTTGASGASGGGSPGAPGANGAYALVLSSTFTGSGAMFGLRLNRDKHYQLVWTSTNTSATTMLLKKATNGCSSPSSIGDFGSFEYNGAATEVETGLGNCQLTSDQVHPNSGGFSGQRSTIQINPHNDNYVMLEITTLGKENGSQEKTWRISCYSQMTTTEWNLCFESSPGTDVSGSYRLYEY